MLKNNKTISALVVIALIGFIDALYLAINHYMGAVPPCSIGGCEVVTTSVYAVFFGVPIALIGTLYYLMVLGLLVAHIDTKKNVFISLVALITTIGALISLYLLYLQIFVLHAICTYCVTSLVTSVLLSVISGIRYFKHRQPITE